MKLDFPYSVYAAIIVLMGALLNLSNKNEAIHEFGRSQPGLHALIVSLIWMLIAVFIVVLYIATAQKSRRR